MPRLRSRPPANTNGSEPPREPPRLLDVRDLAALLRCSPKAVRIMHARKLLPKPLDLGMRRLLWRANDIAAWLEHARTV